METVVALLMFVNFDIKEHRIQESMGMCLRGKREAERQYSETVSYKCVKTQAEVEYIQEKGETAARTRIIRVIEHGYTSDSYDATSKY